MSSTAMDGAEPTATPGTNDAIVAWLNAFAEHVRERRYAEATLMFSPRVLGFGTRAYRVVGVAALEREQWRKIWDNSSGFRFDTSELEVFASGALHCAAVPWSSIGYDATGAPFQRPGRATIVLSLEAGKLIAVHTHFSLAPGVSSRTYPPPPPSGAHE